MEKPYVECTESASGLHVSMVDDMSIMPDDLAYGCNECYNGLSWKDERETSIADEWQDLGDNGVLCPACKDPEDEEDNP